MHNIDDDKIFRPSVWNDYRMDKESLYYRACKTYDPLYK
jgi:L-fucose isomerase